MPEAYRVRRYKHGYAVFDEDGQKITGQSTHAQCLEMIDKIQKSKTVRTRNCLCCGVPFPSEGIGNRICLVCKGSALFQGADPRDCSTGRNL
ncbi:MAG: hypothetical protein AAFR17_12330 [Pseudomonadota bacterium]